MPLLLFFLSLQATAPQARPDILPARVDSMNEKRSSSRGSGPGSAPETPPRAPRPAAPEPIAAMHLGMMKDAGKD